GGHAGPARRRGRPGPAERAPRPRPGPPVGARDTTARPHARSPGERGHPAVGTTAPSAVSRQRAARCPVAAPDPRARLCAGAGCRGACAQARRPVSPGQRVPAARQRRRGRGPRDGRGVVTSEQASFARQLERLEEIVRRLEAEDLDLRSEEHTSELQSPDHLVCRLLLEKKKKKKKRKNKRKHDKNINK